MTEPESNILGRKGDWLLTEGFMPPTPNIPTTMVKANLPDHARRLASPNAVAHLTAIKACAEAAREGKVAAQ